jgi:hypothetical protein
VFFEKQTDECNFKFRKPVIVEQSNFHEIDPSGSFSYDPEQFICTKRPMVCVSGLWAWTLFQSRARSEENAVMKVE